MRGRGKEQGKADIRRRNESWKEEMEEDSEEEKSLYENGVEEV